MLNSFGMERIKNGWVLYMSYNDKRPDETWFCGKYEKGLERIRKALDGQGTTDSDSVD